MNVGHSGVPADFVVVETGGDERSPIILGRPFLCTAKAIYVDRARITFNINGIREHFSFKNKKLESPVHPQQPYQYELTPTAEKKKKINNRRKNKNKKNQVQTTEAWMINPVKTECEFRLKSPLLTKLEDLGIPTIDCSINHLNFQKTCCDTGSGINLISKVTYELIFGNLPLYTTYVQLQMADQSF